MTLQKELATLRRNYERHIQELEESLNKVNGFGSLNSTQMNSLNTTVDDSKLLNISNNLITPIR